MADRRSGLGRTRAGETADPVRAHLRVSRGDAAVRRPVVAQGRDVRPVPAAVDHGCSEPEGTARRHRRLGRARRLHHQVRPRSSSTGDSDAHALRAVVAGVRFSRYGIHTGAVVVRTGRGRRPQAHRLPVRSRGRQRAYPVRANPRVGRRDAAVGRPVVAQSRRGGQSVALVAHRGGEPEGASRRHRRLGRARRLHHQVGPRALAVHRVDIDPVVTGIDDEELVLEVDHSIRVTVGAIQVELRASIPSPVRTIGVHLVVIAVHHVEAASAVCHSRRISVGASQVELRGAVPPPVRTAIGVNPPVTEVRDVEATRGVCDSQGRSVRGIQVELRVGVAPSVAIRVHLLVIDIQHVEDASVVGDSLGVRVDGTQVEVPSCVAPPVRTIGVHLFVAGVHHVEATSGIGDTSGRLVVGSQGKPKFAGSHCHSHSVGTVVAGVRFSRYRVDAGAVVVAAGRRRCPLTHGLPDRGRG